MSCWIDQDEFFFTNLVGKSDEESLCLGRLVDSADFVVVLAAAVVVAEVVAPDRTVPAVVVSVPSRQATGPGLVVVAAGSTLREVWMRPPIPETAILSLP